VGQIVDLASYQLVSVQPIFNQASTTDEATDSPRELWVTSSGQRSATTSRKVWTSMRHSAIPRDMGKDFHIAESGISVVARFRLAVVPATNCKVNIYFDLQALGDQSTNLSKLN
jgi:hypothetical protein